MRSVGEVLFENGDVFFFEMDDTADRALRALKVTPEEVLRDQRSDAGDCICDCGGPSEPVVLISTFSHWPSKACRECMAITGDRDDENYEIGPRWSEPSWALTYCDTQDVEFIKLPHEINELTKPQK